MALVAERGSSVRLSFGSGKVTIEAGTKGQARARETVAGRLLRRTKPRSRSARTTCWTASAAALAAASGTRPARNRAARATPSGTRARPAPKARIRLQFTSPTKPALITGSAGADGESAPDYRYLVVPLRALASV